MRACASAGSSPTSYDTSPVSSWPRARPAISIVSSLPIGAWNASSAPGTPGKNLKSRDMDYKSTVGSSFPRFAPARKSAQIISRP